MTDKNHFFNFNTADPVETPKEPPQAFSVTELKNRLLNRLSDALKHLFPNGVIRGNRFYVGDVRGNPGKSLVVELDGPKAGIWADFESQASGDMLDLWALAHALNSQRDFAQVIEEIQTWLGDAPQSHNTRKKKKTPPIDELGPHSARWDYHDQDGQLIACVYRYDLDDGKEFRPWDVKARKPQAPNPRPLYNQPNLVNAQDIVLVEGEKCADALISQGIIATTAMNGANAPIDKTDWSPLKDKNVLVWPDHDAPGRDYAERVANTLSQLGVRSVAILEPPQDKPEKWDAADAVDEGMDIPAFLKQVSKRTSHQPPTLTAFTLGDLLKDDSPIPDDLIEPRVLTPGGMVVLGGAPKVGKSDFILSWLTYMAAGEPFLDLKPTKRLRIFYLQAEVQYHYLRERLQSMKLPELMVWRASDNLYITPQLRLVLNEEGLNQLTTLLRQVSEKEPLDIIVIDPLRNVFDGGDEGASENDNNAMLFFLKERVEKLRDLVNPSAGIILVHHTKKLSKRQLIEDPFLSLSGAGSLRGYYTTGMLLYRPDENQSLRVLTFELRNGPSIPNQYVDKKNGRWIALDHHSERLVNKDHGEKLDAERRRKQDIILQLIFDEAAQGRVYTIAQFADAFEGRAGLGANRTIQDRIGVSATKGEIKFFRNAHQYGQPRLERSKFGYLCVEGMHLLTQEKDIDVDTGEVIPRSVPILPTHYKCPQTGACLPVENPHVWIYQEDDNDE